MKNDVWENSMFGKESMFHESWDEKKNQKQSSDKNMNCDDLRKNVVRSRPNWMTDIHYSFCKDVCTKIIQEASRKKCSSFGIMFLCAFSAHETGYGTNDASKNKNNYWGLRGQVGTRDEDFSSMSFGEAFDVFWGYLLNKWPDMILFLTSDSYTKNKNVTKQGPYYFTSEEVNQCLNSGRYGGNGNNGTPKIIKGFCYNAEFYSGGIDYGKRVMNVMTKFLIPAFRQTATENSQLARVKCEEVISNLQPYSYLFGIMNNNYSLISSNKYGRYISEVSSLNQDKTPQIKRPNSGLSNRIIIPNEKNVTIPPFD